MREHDFAWTHVGGSTCYGRFVCEYLEHWEARCAYCGELDSAGATPHCEARKRLEDELGGEVLP